MHVINLLARTMRQPAVAGKFYPRSEADLRGEIENCFTSPLGPGEVPQLAKEGRRTILGAVVPHAGYPYSGPVAAHVYNALARDGFPKTFVILGPNHNAFGAPVAVSTEDFQTPMGVMKVDTELASRLDGVIERDPVAHRLEHSIEVQLPFIQYFSRDAKIVPIAMTAQDYETSREVGEELRKAIEGKDVVIIASSDFSHYVPAQEAHAYDTRVIDQIISRNAKGVYDTVVRYNISMCGYGPVMAMLEATRARSTILFKYATSGDVTPMSEVVGYAGIVVTK
jgi:AmmeMemoRadiSam system protein B